MAQGFFVSSASSCPSICLAHEDADSSDPPMWISSEPLPISVCTFDLKVDLDSNPVAIDTDDEDALTHSVTSLVSLVSMDLEDGDPYYPNVATRQPSRIFPCTQTGCPKAFLTEDDMAVHLRGHGPITFPCTICGLDYPRQRELFEHQKACPG